MTGKPPPRFSLDEAAAREWLDDEVFDLYVGADDWEGSETRQLIDQALDKGVMTDTHQPPGPAQKLHYSFESDSDGSGYRWLVEVIDLTLCTDWEEIRTLGDIEARPGVENALSVLRAAVAAGNLLMARLAAGGYTPQVTS